MNHGGRGILGKYVERENVVSLGKLLAELNVVSYQIEVLAKQKSKTI